MEAIKLLTGMGEPLEGKLMVCDFSDMHIMTVAVYKRPNCPVCHGEITHKMEKERLTWLCGQDTVNVNPPRLIEVNMEELVEKLQSRFKVLVKSPIVIVFQYGDQIEVSFFQGGRMLIKNVKDEDIALKVYSDVWKKLGFKP
jgi:hypothetical protein